jgi:hypothetical protein
MHKEVKSRRITGTGGKDKVIVMGMLQRGGKVKATVVEDRSTTTLHSIVLGSIAAGAEVITDELVSYKGLDNTYVHNVINHANEYVKGHIHTNGMENFWSLLKRGLNGTYVAVRPFHLFRYIDEQVFRYNNRKDIGDGGRFDLCVTQGFGKRLTYKQLTGKTDQVPF